MPKSARCTRCGSDRLELEPAAQHRKIERIVVTNLGIASVGAISAAVGHAMLHSPEAHHTWACVLLIGGIAMVTLATMIIAVFAMREQEPGSQK